MKPNRTLRRSLIGLGLLSAALTAFFALRPTPAYAHEATCPRCKLDVVQDTDEIDNEVPLRYGRKRIEYRCIMCALAEAKTKYKNDLSILAPSSVKGKPVVLTRKDGQWSVAPETAVFVGVPGSHTECQIRFRAMTDRAAFDAYVAKHAEILKGAEPLTFEQLLEMAK